ncbi:MAG TPA: hypothetical protein VI455_20795 [Terriglobia bacterium]
MSSERIAGTILEGTRKPLRTWFQAMWFVTNRLLQQAVEVDPVPYARLAAGNADHNIVVTRAKWIGH